MSKYSLFPVIITKQLDGAVYIKANGVHYGYTTLHYSLYGSNVVHTLALTDDELSIDNFPEGTGRYRIWLVAPDGSKTAETEFYYNRDSNVAIYEKILSYLYDLNDKQYARDLINGIRTTRIGYTHQIVKEFSKTKAPTDFELESFYELIASAERYENMMAISFNRSYLHGLVCHYEASFSLTAPPSFTSVDIIQYAGDMPVYSHTEEITIGQIVQPLFTPGHYYRLDFFCGAEQVLSLVHYQPDEAGAARLWQRSQERHVPTDIEVLNDTELHHSGIELTDDDKQRLIEERRLEPRNIFVDRPIVDPGVDPYVLDVTIADYKLLKESTETYYLSVVEKDLSEDGSFDHRLAIDAPVVKVQARELMLDDEILLCVKDSEGNAISKYARYFLSYDYDDDINEYIEKRGQVELTEYADQLLDGFKNAFGAGELYNAFSDVVIPLCKECNLELQGAFDKIILAAAKMQKIVKERDNILFFVEDNWMKLRNYDSEFFTEPPVFYYSEGRITFPNDATEYTICIDRYDLLNDTATHEYISSKKSSGISMKIDDADLCCVRAIDIKNKKTSGWVFFNNLGKHEYYRDQMDMEVVIYHGQRN